MTAETEQIRALLDQGLSHYGLGEVQRALAAWRQVLEMDPNNPRALEYIRFVEENWAPNAQQRDAPYRPDVGSDPFAGSSGEITVEATAETSGEATVEAQPQGFARPRTPGPAEPPRAPVPESPPDPAPQPPAEQRRDPQSGFIQPVRPQVNIWGDLYAAEGKSSPAPAQPQAAELPPSEHQPAAAPPAAEPPVEPVRAAPPVVADPWGAPAEAGAAGAADSGVWERPPELAPGPGVGEEAGAGERVEQIRSSTLPARPDSESDSVPPDEPAPPSAAETVQPAPPPDPEATEPAPKPAAETVQPAPLPVPEATEPAPKPAAEAVEPAPQRAVKPAEPEPPAAAAETTAPAAVDGWGASLGGPAAPQPDPQRLVIDPTPPFSEAQSEPGGADRFGSATGPPAAAAGSALDLVAGEEAAAAEAVVEPEVTTGIDSWLAGARDLLELDDFSGAIELLDKVLAEQPEHAEAAELRQEAEAELLKMYSSKLGDLDAVPRVRMASDEIIWLNLDHRAGFVLSMIDGHICYEDILSVSGLPRLEGMRILAQLVQEKVIAAD